MATISLIEKLMIINEAKICNKLNNKTLVTKIQQKNHNFVYFNFIKFMIFYSEYIFIPVY